MYRILTVLMGTMLFLSSCKKEESVEKGQPAQGSLQDDLGDCLPKKVNGTYVVNETLTDSNYIEVAIDVVKAGAYTVFTDTLNGYSFKGNGNFGTPGVNIVRLKSIGKPLAAGDDDFTVIFDSSFCTVQVSVTPAGGSSGTAVYSLQGTPGACTGFIPAGTYTQGTALGTTNKVTLSVNVTAPGTWAISTPSVTGFSFAGAGTFTATGVQNIPLTGTGTPTASGVQTFMVTVGASSCTFPITVAVGTTPVPGIYFPMTAASWWSYDNGTAGSDTIKTTVNGTGTFLGKTYQRFITTDEFGPFDTAFYRKDNTTNFYYLYSDTSGFGSFGVTFPQAGLDVLFLKDALNTNDVINSDHAAKLGGVTNVTVRIQSKVIDANSSITVNGKNFTNVYKIELMPQLGLAGTFQNLSLTPIVYYYAKGIGLIKITDGTDSQDIRYWKIN